MKPKTFTDTRSDDKIIKITERKTFISIGKVRTPERNRLYDP